MLVYRFRLWSDVQDDFIREIEIQPGQTFLDFHDAILSSADFDRCDKSFFFYTDRKTKKQREISLKTHKTTVKRFDEEEGEMVTDTIVAPLMKETKLKDVIDDPHQRLAYEFHGKDHLAFNIELFKVYKTDEPLFLPRCVKSAGELTKKVDIPVAPVMAPPEEEAAIHLPLLAGTPDSLFDGIQEPDAELAEIENELSDIFAGGGAREVQVEEPEERVAIEGMEEEEEEEENRMESLDDYEDIEGLEIKRRDFSADSDDY